MHDKDHLVEQTGYVDPMAVLAQTFLLSMLSYSGNAHMLGIELTQQEREQATTSEACRKLFLSKLQERF